MPWYGTQQGSTKHALGLSLGMTLGCVLLATLHVLRVDAAQFKAPMCNASGKCFETANVASPRTNYSAKSRTQLRDWNLFHAELARDAVDFASRARTLPPLVLIGDSITESWRGTSLGAPVQRAAGVPTALATATNGAFDPLVLGMAGDQTQHVLHRIRGPGSELAPLRSLEASSSLEPLTFVLLIGTNNLGSGHLPAPTAAGVVAVADALLEDWPGATLLLLAVLPRSDDSKLENLCPPRCSSPGVAFASFAPAVDKVNAALALAAPNIAERHPSSRFALVDCGEAFRAHPELMPDHLHPGATGHAKLAECIMSGLKDLASAPP